MRNQYRIEERGSHFAVINPWSEQVGLYSTKQAAKNDMDRLEKADMLESARIIAENAIQAHMHIHGVDFETARYWVSHAVLWNYANTLTRKQ